MYSNLVCYVRLSPNCTKRAGKVTGITIHHAAANASVEALGVLFADPARQASANYGIGSDGRVACFVPEEYRAWTSGNRENDERCITIEVANCSGAPDWKISDAAMTALIALCADICARWGFTLNYTGSKTGNLTMHKWFAPTACPGPYLEGKFPAIAQQVNSRLAPKERFYRVQVGAFRDKANAQRLLETLKQAGYADAFLVEVQP